MNISNIGFYNKEENIQETYKGTERGSVVREKTMGFMQPSAMLDSTEQAYGAAMGDKLQEIQDKAQSLVQGTTTNHAEFIANSMSETDASMMEEQGISPKDEDVEVMVTVVDKIQMEMAKGQEGLPLGADISREQIEAEVGNAAMAYQMAEKLTTVTKEEAAYLINNEMEPTIGNLYQAQSSAYGQKAQIELTPEVQQQIQQKVAEYTGTTIRQNSQTAGVEKVATEDLELANWMVSTGIAFTKETFLYAKDLMSVEMPPTQETVNQAIWMAAQSGNLATDAMVLADHENYIRAIKGNEVVKQATEEQVIYLIEQGRDVNLVNLEAVQESDEAITIVATDKTIGTTEQDNVTLRARRILEETRLYMTAKANLSLLKKGIQIKTKPLEELVETLKQQEQEYRTAVYGENPEGEEIFSTVKEEIQQFKDAPVALLPRISFQEMTLPQVVREGQELAATYRQANISYETMMTQPRADLGDNIQTAFRNVNDILEDMGLETSASNQRAVRILGYNQMEITQEAISTMKLRDEQVQQLFSNMTPRVVLSMIREGYNPLQVPLQELNDKAAQMREVLDPQGMEKYSEFLVDLEQHNEITQEERDSYIGIYRLLHQVAKSDGAAIGAVYMAEEELTMKNLLTQVRNQKSSGYERVVDEETGVIKNSFVADLSITQQIEAAYQTACAGEALKQMSVGKLRAAEEQGDIQQMSPEQMLEAFRQANDLQEQEVQEYISQQEKTVLRQAAMADQQVMDMLTKLDMQKSPENIVALQEMLGNRNKLFRTLFDEKNKNKELVQALKAAKEQIWADFSEALSEPEEMAEAQEALAKTAENVMEGMLEDTEMSSLDVQELRRMSRQLEITMARSKREEYAIPVLVSDEYGTVSLKIVRGEEEEGKVAITLETDKYGKLAASFSAVSNSLQGYVVSDKDETTEKMKAQDETLRAKITQFSGITLERGSIAYVTSKELSLTVFEKGAGESADTQASKQKVLTKTLYGVAKGFLTNLQEFSQK